MIRPIQKEAASEPQWKQEMVYRERITEIPAVSADLIKKSKRIKADPWSG